MSTVFQYATCNLAWLLLVLLLSFANTAAASAKSARADDNCIAVIASNDLHGAILPQHDDDVPPRGGLLALSGYIDILRQRYDGRILLLDGGDLFQGTLASNYSRGEAIIAAYNHLGYTASAIGNHEFDFGPGDANPTTDRRAVLKQRLSQATFPFLAANIFEQGSKQRVSWPNTKPSTIIDVGDLKFGIIGISTPQTPRTTRWENVNDLDFRAPQPLVIAQARELRHKGADMIVLVGHIGDRCRAFDDPDDRSSCRGDGELFRLLDGLPTGLVDIAIGGHTHALVAHRVNGTATMETGARGQHLVWSEVCKAIDGKSQITIHAPQRTCLREWDDDRGGCSFRRASKGAPKAHHPGFRPARFLGVQVLASASLERLLSPYLARVQELAQKKIGALLPDGVYRGTGANDDLGALVADAARRAVNAQIGVQNRGGVRANLSAGPVLYEQVFEVLPFGNYVAKLSMNGAKLLSTIAKLRKRRGGRLPYLAGLQQSGGIWILKNGTAIENSEYYTVATNDYLATGGEGLVLVGHNSAANPGGGSRGRVEITTTLLRDALIDLLVERYPLDR